MKYYSGNRAPFVEVLFSESDSQKVTAVCSAMEGLRFAPLNAVPRLNRAKRACAAVVFLSAGFGENPTLCDAFFAVKDAGVPIIPVRLDNAPLPEALEQALYARNSISAEKYSTDRELADRIRTAPALAAPAVTAAQKKAARRSTGLLAGALAAVMVLIVLIPVSRLRQPADRVQVVENVNLLGLTQQDLKEITGVLIVGDRIEFYRENTPHLQDGSETPALCFSMFGEDGSPLWPDSGAALAGDFAAPLTRQELDVLALLPNLETIDLIRVEADCLPDLSGLQKLKAVVLRGCRIPDLSGLSGSGTERLELSMAPGTDLAPLTGCEKLNTLVLDACGTEPDFTGFAPPALKRLSLIWSAGFYLGREAYTDTSAPKPGDGPEWVLDTPLWQLTALRQLSTLESLQLQDIPITDINFLQGMPRLEELSLTAAHLLSDSGLENLTALRRLTIRQAGNLTDLPAVQTCTGLEYFYLQDFGDSSCDMAFLRGLANLKDIHLLDCYPENVDFLTTLAADTELNLTVSLWGDASGLAAVTRYGSLCLDIPDNEPLNYLRNATVAHTLTVKGCTGLDLTALPGAGELLELENCNLRSLEALNILNLQCEALSLKSDNSLRTLKGLEGWSTLRRISIYDCPRLQDLTALENRSLESLSLTGVPVVPDFSGMEISERLYLSNIYLLEDLRVLDSLKTRPKEVYLLQLTAVNDPQPLQQLKGGALYVSPDLERFAALMAGAGSFESSTILDRDRQLTLSLKLESLADLELFPESMLCHVTELYVMGDTVYDRDAYFTTTRWNGHASVPALARVENYELVYLETGEGTVTSMEQLAKLTGLETLCLEDQPLTNLAGIEKLSSLKQLKVSYCKNLTDISAAFLLDRLERLEVNNTAVSSLQGIENLPRLRYLDVQDTGITDLAPLARGDYSYSAKAGGATLMLSGTGSSDPAFLSGFPYISCLNLQDTGLDLYATLHSMAGCRLETLYLSKVPNNETVQLLKQFPELTSLTIYDSPKVTDLSPLLQLENLQFVQLNGLSDQAYQSLSGQPVSFRLNIW